MSPANRGDGSRAPGPDRAGPATRRKVLSASLRLAVPALAALALPACSPPRVLTPAPSAAPGTATPLAPTPEPTAARRPVAPSPTAVPELNVVPAVQTTAPAPVLVGTLRLATNHAAAEVPWLTKVLDLFRRRQTGAAVEHTNVTSHYLERVPAWAAQGTLPDVLFVRGQHVAAWAYRRWLAYLDDLVGRDAREVAPDDFHPAQVEELKHQGKWIALPYDYSVPGVYCQADHLAEVGVARPSESWEWAELLSLARQLTRRDGDRVARWGFNWRPEHGEMPGVWYADGGSFLTPDRRGVVVGTAENIRTTQFMADLSEVERVAPRVGELAPGAGPFGAGRVSLEVGGSWAAAAYQRALGSATDAGRAKVDLIGVPRGSRSRPSVMGNGGAWAISRDSRRRELAWELVKHLASRDSLELLLALPIRNLPGRISAAPLWLESLRAIGAPGHAETFIRMAEEAYPLQPVPWWLDYQDAYEELMPLVWAGRKQAADVLPELERRVNAAAARYT